MRGALWLRGGGGLGGAVLHHGLPVVLWVGVLAPRQLQEGGEAVQVGHLVEGSQQQVHHHQAQEQVGCWGEWGEERRRGGGGGGRRQNTSESQLGAVLCQLWSQYNFSTVQNNV